MARSATGARPLLATAAGLVVGALAVAALASAGWPRRTGRTAPAVVPDLAAAQRFLGQWRRMRLGAWVVEARFERVTREGRRIETTVHMAQRPPDRLVTGLGTIDARRGGQRLACAPDEAGTVVCRTAGAGPSYAAEVQQELAYLRRYVLGPAALYAVTTEGNCSALRLRVAIPSPPYGERARFCFDGPTGAPVRSEVDRAEARDRTVASSVRAQPTDADLDPKGWGGGGRG